MMLSCYYYRYYVMHPLHYIMSTFNIVHSLTHGLHLIYKSEHIQQNSSSASLGRPKVDQLTVNQLNTLCLY